ncbi:MAG: two-component sensor histidine kinase [Tannerellaceae bacterium]|jgi:two-component system OmpR family sensor kinase/two-component system phosphate regulon sensor histidine kinase PhoR|nr:two-component sensor histidine kinase [Tannerellaceae bacterium]
MRLRIRTSYRSRIFGYFLAISLLFAAGVVLIERKEEKTFRRADLEARLDGYTEIVHQFIRLYGAGGSEGSSGPENLDELSRLMPEHIRISVIGEDGAVLFDNEVGDVEAMESHLNRPEIMNALYSSYGSNVRLSASTKREYLYYARRFPPYYVRVALPYDIKTRNMLEAGNLFVYMIAGLLAVVLVFINFVAGRFGKSIIQLKRFSSAIREGRPIPEHIRFQEDELGEIGSELIDIFKQMEESKKNTEIEREKLIRHFRFSGEGLCIFSHDMKKIYANTGFIQYINLITDHPTFDAVDILKDRVFEPIQAFIGNKERETNHMVFHVNRSGKNFSIQTVIFEDGSFEIIIKDVSKAEKTRLMKQEMTSNIAHELRTPVTSLRGYLETLSNNSALDGERRKQFIDRAFLQTIRLSNLIEDVSIISKIEEAPSQFTIESLNLALLVNDVRIDLADKLAERRITFTSALGGDLTVTGNYTLLYSIFRNLVDNSISYAGRDIEIHIRQYAKDERHYYFSYYDTGTGVREEYLGRIFERFYRVSEGRTRDSGGSGLGLSIVRNAILFHKGDIQAKNRVGGGLEFLFTLRR